MKKERDIITIDEYGKVTMPTDISTTAMTEWELCNLFGMFGTLGKVSITGSLSQVGIMKILIIERSITLPLPYMFTRTWQGMF